MNLRKAATLALEALEQWKTYMPNAWDEYDQAAVDSLQATLLTDVSPAQMAHADAVAEASRLHLENQWLKDDLLEAARAVVGDNPICCCGEPWTLERVHRAVPLPCFDYVDTAHNFKD